MSTGTVYVENTGSGDLFVTIKDRNTANNDVIWNKQRLNEDDSAPITCEINGSFEANLEWVAVRTDDQTVTGSGVESVDEGGTLQVYAR